MTTYDWKLRDTTNSFFKAVREDSDFTNSDENATKLNEMKDLVLEIIAANENLRDLVEGYRRVLKDEINR